jgi:hypothetical protein
VRTEDLISSLAASREPVDRHRSRRLIASAAGLSLLIAASMVVMRLGARPDLAQLLSEPRAVAKLIFAAAAVAASFFAVLRLARPGTELSEAAPVLAVPFAFVLALAAWELSFHEPTAWAPLLFGSSWLACVTAIPLYAVVPFGLVLLALRESAPTDLRGAGFAAGLLAGSLATLAYEVHCTEDAMPFVAAWYGGSILAIGLAGALLAPRLVRW